MKALHVIVFIIFQISFCELKILANEQKVIKSLVNFFQIRRCLFINEFEHFATLAKSLSSDYVYATVFDIEQLGDYVIPVRTWPDLMNIKDFPTKTAVIWKTDFKTFRFEFSVRLGKFQKFMSPYIWILIANSDFADFDDLLQTYIPYDCKFFVVHSKDGFNYRILKTYKVKLTSNMTIKNFGEWDAQNGFSINELRTGQDFQSEELLLSVNENQIRAIPILSKTLELWYDLGKMLNFTTYEMTILEAENEGLETELLTQDLDAKIIPATKSSFIPMIYPFWNKKVYMHVKYEGDQITSLEALLRPFTFNVWKAIAFGHIISTITIIIIEFLTLKINKNQPRTFYLIDSSFTPLEMFFNQGGCDPLYSPSSRISYLSLWIQISILLPAYTGAVVSFLTMSIPRLPFDDLDTFIENGAYKFIGENRSYMKGYFEMGKAKGNAKLALIYDKFFIKPSLMPRNVLEGVNQVCSRENLVLLGYENEAFENLKDHPECKLLKIPRSIFSMDAGLPLNRLSPFTAAFNKKFTYFRTSGILQKLNRDVSQTLNEPQFDDFDPIEFTKIIPLLSFLSALTGISILILLIEKFFNYHFLQRRNLHDY